MRIHLLSRSLAVWAVAACVAVLLLGGRAEAQSTYTWNKASGTYSWNSTANWSPSTGFPNAAGDVANLNNFNLTGGVIVNLNETITVGQLLIGENGSSNGWHAYTIAAGTAGSLVFDATSGNAILSKPTAANATTDTISANVTLNDNLSLTNAALGGLTISGSITDDSNSRSITKLGSGLVVLSGTNSYSGGTTVSAGSLQFNSAAAIAGTGRDVTVSPGATVAAGYAINNAFLNRVAESNDAFTVALGANSSSNLDFSSSAGATLGNARLGATGAFTYSGLLTPSGTTYRLGGGGGTLTVSSALNDSSGATSVLIDYSGGTVILSGANGYAGGTTVTAGTLRFSSAGAIGGTGRNVTVSPGATVAAGYAIDNAFLNRLADSNDAFTVALGANSSSNLDFSSSAGATLGNARLGATGAFTYSGVLTPSGTTYRLGGGGGTLTVSSALTDSPGSVARSLVVDASSGGGTVILSGTGNTFTGATTVANGTLQLNTAGAFNNIARTVSINSGGVLTFNAADAAKAAAVTVNSGGLANFSAASAANGGTFTISSGGTAAVTASSGISGGTFTVNSGGVLRAGTNLAAVAANSYTGGSVRLNGGTVSFDTGALSGTLTVGGNFSVDASSTFNPYGGNNNQVLTAVWGTLNFSGDGYTLTFSNANNYTAKPVTVTSRFVGSTFSHSGTLGVNATKTLVELNNTAIRAGKTLTKTGGQAFTVSGSLGVALLGGAELLAADSFTMITAANTFTNTSTFDTTNGLWSVSGGTSPVRATLAAPVGSIANGQSVAFTASNAASVSLTGLTNGNAYPLTISLENAADQATVMSQLAKNPAFSNIAASGSSQIAMLFTAPAETTRFAWDNVHTSSGDWYLGGNLTGVAAAFSVADPAAELNLSGPLGGSSDLNFGGPGRGIVSGAISGAGRSLKKTGLGALTLTAANTFTGDTIIQGGTLKLGSGGSFANSPRIVVGDAASDGAVLDLTDKTSFSIGASQTLMGKGTALLGENTSLTVAGLFSPGNSPGLFTYDGGSTTLSGTTLMEIWGTTRGTNPGYDAVNVINSGLLTLGGILELNFNQSFADNDSFTLFDTLTSGSLAGGFTGITITGSSSDYLGLSFTQVGNVWTTGTTGSNQSLRLTQTGSAVTLVVVPEPAAIALLASAALTGWAAWNRRRKGASHQI